MNGRLHNKTAVVTGAASGIGAASARRCVAEGAQVLLTDLNQEAGRALAEELGSSALFMHQDVSSPDDWNSLQALLRERFGRLDVLVNNAGILIPGNLEQATLDEWQRIMQVNATSTFLGCQCALRMMKAHTGGSIVNISSIAALAGHGDYLAYSASKGAVAALTRSVAVHCRREKYRIRCNSLHPDGVLTAMTRASYPERMDPEKLTIDHDPMHRMCRPEDVANAVLWLASDESRAVNGMELRVDSGQFVMSI